jgi:hypothetical protein
MNEPKPRFTEKQIESFLKILKGLYPIVKGKVSCRKLIKQIHKWAGGILMPIYPVAVFCALLYFCTSTGHAGVIRRISVSRDRPTVVRVARGRTTAIQFWIKPEKLVLGSPNRVQVDFLGKDVTVTPLAPDPGNLLIYTRDSRFVVLFQMVQGGLYDDVVELVPAHSETGRAIRLAEDTYHVVGIHTVLEMNKKKQEADFPAILKDEGRRLETDQWPEFVPSHRLKCARCIVQEKNGNVMVICSQSLLKVECTAPKGIKITFERATP